MSSFQDIIIPHGLVIFILSPFGISFLYLSVNFSSPLSPRLLRWYIYFSICIIVPDSSFSGMWLFLYFVFVIIVLGFLISMMSI